MKLKIIIIDFIIIMSHNTNLATYTSTSSEKPAFISPPPPPPHHPRLIRSGGDVIPDVIAPAMSGSILIDPRTSKPITYN